MKYIERLIINLTCKIWNKDPLYREIVIILLAQWGLEYADCIPCKYNYFYGYKLLG